MGEARSAVQHNNGCLCAVCEVTYDLTVGEVLLASNNEWYEYLVYGRFGRHGEDDSRGCRFRVCSYRNVIP